MKIASRHIAFVPAGMWPTRRRLNFGKGGSTLDLQETALVVEGYLQRLFFPLLDRLFQLALSEWTTATIPYSRILEYGYDSRLVLRTLLALVLCLPILLLASVGADFLALLPALVVLLLVWFIVRPRSHLIFRQADGERAILCFHIPSEKRRREFEQALEANRAAVRGKAKQADPGEEPGVQAPLGVLGILLGGSIAADLYQLSQSPMGRFLPLPSYFQRGATQLIEALPLFLLAASLIYRQWLTRLMAAAAVATRGLMPLIAYWSRPAPPAMNELGLFVGPLFHLILAGVLITTVPRQEKGVSA